MPPGGIRPRRETRTRINAYAYNVTPTWVSEVQADYPDIWYRLNDTGAGPFIEQQKNMSATPNGTIVSDTSLLVSDPNAAAKFDWSSGTLQHATTSYNIAQQPLTAEVWVKPIALDGQAQGSAIIMGCGPTGGWAIECQDADGTWTLTYETVAFYNFSSSVKAAVGVTQHLVFVMQSGNTIDFYVNGVFQQTLATGTMAPTANNFCIARKDGFGSGFPRCTIDEVLVYKSPLSAARIAAHYIAGIAGRYPYSSAFPPAHGARVVHRPWAGRS